MSSEVSSANGKKKTKKLANVGSSSSNEILSSSLTTSKSQTNRIGPRVYKCVILGDGGVGKSAVTLQFVSHSFLDYHDPTIEDSYQQQAIIDGEPALLDILDTAGQVEFTAMRDQYMRCGEGFIICYSICDRHSFQEASEYRKLIARVRLTEDIPLVLVANKLDLQSQRKVSLEEGKALAMQFGCPFYETSAALRCNVDEVFYTLVREIRRKDAQKLYEINDDPKRKEFLDDLFMFMKDRGTPINRLPIMAKSVLDLYELYKLVIGRGGLVNVINKKLWQEIIKDLNLPSSITSAAFTLRTQYTKYLYPYECEKYNLSSDSELQAAIENNKRDGSRRSTASSYNQFSPQSPQTQHQQLQLQAMASQLAASNSSGLNLSTANGSASNQPSDLSNNQPLNEIQLATHQRFMMLMFLYQQFLQAQTQPT